VTQTGQTHVACTDALPDRITRARERVRMELLSFLPPHVMSEARACISRLLDVLPEAHLPNNRVLVAYGGGKDSSYTVAFLRLIQLEVDVDRGQTFQLRIATNRHVGMPPAVLTNIDRAYTALGLLDDPAAELLLIDGNYVQPFRAEAPLPAAVVARNRLDILMSGHRCQGEARPTFCNACNLSMLNACALAANFQTPVHVVVTGDSQAEQRTYFAWLRHTAVRFGVPGARDGHDFRAFLRTADGIAQHYLADVYGTDPAAAEVVSHRIHTDESMVIPPTFFSIYEHTAYQAEAHWALLTQFLGFQFDELAFSFTESDCANPAVMCHLRGLRAEHIHGRSYADGVAEYVDFAIRLMLHKEYPPHLVAVMRQRYASPEAIATMRTKLNQFVCATIGLTEAHLVCMLYSPFAQQGANLATYLRREQPDLLEHLTEIHQLLSDHPLTDPLLASALADRLSDVAQLDLSHLRALYRMSLALRDPTSPMAVILTRDPHKAMIRTRHGPDGPIIEELISGR
jgi:hypothetical protein